MISRSGSRELVASINRRFKGRLSPRAPQLRPVSPQSAAKHLSTGPSRLRNNAMAESTPEVSITGHHPVFTQKVVAAMRDLFPEEWADKSWDNVGLLLGNLQSRSREEKPIVLLTNDLTPQVGAEATEKGASVIVSYHPFIFKPLRAITAGDWQQRLLLHLVQHNIAVYSPHTAVDAAADGLNDWLLQLVLRKEDGLVARSVVHPVQAAVAPTHSTGVGYGRRCEIANAVSVGELVQRLASGLGGLRYVAVARPRGRERPVRSLAVCVGSGGDVLRDCDADVLITGEMTHHAALRATMEGRYVITVFHSNSERLYLRQKLQPMLKEKLREAESTVQVLVSDADEEPFEIWDVTNLPASAGDGKRAA